MVAEYQVNIRYIINNNGGDYESSTRFSEEIEESINFEDKAKGSEAEHLSSSVADPYLTTSMSNVADGGYHEVTGDFPSPADPCLLSADENIPLCGGSDHLHKSAYSKWNGILSWWCACEDLVLGATNADENITGCGVIYHFRKTAYSKLRYCSVRTLPKKTGYKREESKKEDFFPCTSPELSPEEKENELSQGHHRESLVEGGSAPQKSRRRSTPYLALLDRGSKLSTLPSSWKYPLLSVWALAFFLPTSAATPWITVRFGARVLAVGDTATFTCAPPSRDVDSIQWLINGSEIDTLHIVNERRSFNDIALAGTLELSNLGMEFNETTIRCLAVAGSSVMLSPDTYTILIEDALSKVGSLMVNELTISWNAPFSLRNDPITYCVDVGDYSQCGITDTVLKIPPPPGIACNLYNVTVTPVNSIGNGTASSVVQSFLAQGPPVLTLSRVYFDGANLTFQLNATVQVCSGTVTLENRYGGSIQHLPLLQNETYSEMISFSNSSLAMNQLYHAMFDISNIIGSYHMIDINKMISTHDVQRVEIAHNLSLSVDYIEGSQAKGVLCLLLLRTPEGLDLLRSVQVIVNGSDDILQIPGGTYMALAFDVESDGLLQQEELFPACTEDDHTVSGTNTDPSFKQLMSDDVKCTVLADEMLITVSCTCQRAAGYQAIFQYTSSNASELYVINGNCSRSVARSVEKSGHYYVVVFPIKEGSGIVDSLVSHSEEVIVGATKPVVMVVVVTVVILVVVMVVAMILVLYQKRICQYCVWRCFVSPKTIEF